MLPKDMFHTKPPHPPETLELRGLNVNKPVRWCLTDIFNIDVYVLWLVLFLYNVRGVRGQRSGGGLHNPVCTEQMHKQKVKHSQPDAV